MQAIAISMRQKVISLRQSECLSLQDIADRTGISKTSTARILKDYPLKKEEIRKLWHSKVAGKRRLVYDLTNQKFGRLTAIRPDYTPRKKHDTYWLCTCGCGKEHFVTSYHLRHGMIKSCGCLSAEATKRRQQKSPRQTNIHSLFLSYKKSAQVRGISFELAKSDCEELFEQNCFYCDSSPARERKVHKNQNEPGREDGFLYNGIDRRNNELGYTLENCVPCCSRCNYAKRDIDESEFVAWLDQITKYRLFLKGENNGF